MATVAQCRCLRWDVQSLGHNGGRFGGFAEVGCFEISNPGVLRQSRLGT